MKRRSSTKPPDFVFFTDRDLGITIPDALSAAGYPTERHDDHFDDPATPDLTWLRYVGERDWIAVSHNWKIRNVRDQLDMAMRSRLALFFLIGACTHDQHARNLVLTAPRILAFRKGMTPVRRQSPSA